MISNYIRMIGGISWMNAIAEFRSDIVIIKFYDSITRNERKAEKSEYKAFKIRHYLLFIYIFSKLIEYKC